MLKSLRACAPRLCIVPQGDSFIVAADSPGRSGDETPAAAETPSTELTSPRPKWWVPRWWCVQADKCEQSAIPQELQTNQNDMPSQASSTNHSSQITSVLVHNMAGDVVAELKPAPESVADLKDLLARHCGLPFAVLRLLHGDQVLQDEDVLSAHGPHCEVLLVIMRQPQSAEELTFLAKIGQGFFATVWKCTHSGTGGSTCAVKKIPRALINEHMLHHAVRREFEIHRSLSHPHIVQVYFHFSDADFFYLGMDFVEDGTLFDLCARHGRLTQDQTRQYFYEVCDAIHYLHNLRPDKIAHRDVKQENVLLAVDGRSKLTDFGWTNIVSGVDSRRTFCGTCDCLSPEMIRGLGHDEKVDIWSLGVMLYECLTGVSPFHGSSMEQTCRKILTLSWRFPTDFPEMARDLASRLCVIRPEFRVTAAQAKCHPFIESHRRTIMSA